MQSPIFQIFKSIYNHHYYFRLRDNNGETICRSEGYETKDEAEKGIQFIKTYSQAALVEDLSRDAEVKSA